MIFYTVFFICIKFELFFRDFCKMENIIQNIIKRQNQELLKQIAKDYNIDEAKLLQNFHTPTFYAIQIDENKKYKITKK